MSGFWIAVALVFGVGVWVVAGPQRGGEYFAGYIIEKSLSADNVFVFALIFSYFAVPARYQYRVLFWGVVGALVLRGVFVLVGAGLLERYDWMIYVFGKTFPDYKLGWIEVPRPTDRGPRRAVGIGEGLASLGMSTIVRKYKTSSAPLPRLADRGLF